jgi:hypothetical protein
MISLAEQHDLVLGFGLAARNDRDIISNAYAFVSARGVLGHYLKTHIPIAEYPIETPGNDFTVTDLGPVRMDVNICTDETRQSLDSPPSQIGLHNSKRDSAEKSPEIRTCRRCNRSQHEPTVFGNTSLISWTLTG